MADKKISGLNPATLPLAGTELVPIVQGGETKKVSVSEISGNNVTEAPIDGLTYGRKDAEWVEISDSGTPTLQEVLDFNNDLFTGNNFQGTGAGAGQTGEDVNAFGHNSAISNNKDNVNAFGFQSAYDNSGDNVNAFGFNAGASNTFKNINAFGFEARADADNQTIFSKWISGVTKYLGRLSFNNITADRKWELPDASGTIALTSEIPPSITIDATPTDGSSNAVSSNGVFDGLALKQDLAVARTGAVIAFDALAVYNTFSSPTASNITDSLGTAKIGIVQKIYSNKATEPTYPAGWVKLSGTYTNSVTNIIYCEWCEGSRVEYWIVEA